MSFCIPTYVKLYFAECKEPNSAVCKIARSCSICFIQMHIRHGHYNMAYIYNIFNFYIAHTYQM